jgi:hypothetical protein
MGWAWPAPERDGLAWPAPPEGQRRAWPSHRRAGAGHSRHRRAQGAGVGRYRRESGAYAAPDGSGRHKAGHGGGEPGPPHRRDARHGAACPCGASLAFVLSFGSLRPGADRSTSDQPRRAASARRSHRFSAVPRPRARCPGAARARRKPCTGQPRAQRSGPPRRGRPAPRRPAQRRPFRFIIQSGVH